STVRSAEGGRPMASAGVVEFELAPELEAGEPPEARGLRRDEVRLLVSDLERDAVEHARFFDLPRWLDEGDLLVVNTSGTLSASLPATTPDGRTFEAHLSTRLPGGFWTIEIRLPGAKGSRPFRDARPGVALRLPGGGALRPLAPYPHTGSLESGSRLWI